MLLPKDVHRCLPPAALQQHAQCAQELLLLLLLAVFTAAAAASSAGAASFAASSAHASQAAACNMLVACRRGGDNKLGHAPYAWHGRRLSSSRQVPASPRLTSRLQVAAVRFRRRRPGGLYHSCCHGPAPPANSGGGGGSWRRQRRPGGPGRCKRPHAESVKSCASYAPRHGGEKLLEAWAAGPQVSIARERRLQSAALLQTLPNVLAGAWQQGITPLVVVHALPAHPALEPAWRHCTACASLIDAAVIMADSVDLPVSLLDVQEAATRIAPYIHTTPVRLRPLNDLRCYMKLPAGCLPRRCLPPPAACRRCRCRSCHRQVPSPSPEATRGGLCAPPSSSVLLRCSPAPRWTS